MKNFLSLALLCSFVFSASSFAGTPSQKIKLDIIGGENVKAEETIAKRTVALFFKTLDGSQSLCTGAIIDTRHILTAAHCIDNIKAGYVVFTRNDVISILGEYTEHASILRKISSVKMFPGYDEDSSGEFVDMGIVTFEGGMPAGYEVAKFLDNSSLFSTLYRGMTVTLAGYGVAIHGLEDAETAGAGTLRRVDVQYLLMGGKKENFIVRRKNHIACHGDSGGPAFIETEDDIYVIGIASRSDCQEDSIYSFIDQETLSQSLIRL